MKRLILTAGVIVMLTSATPRAQQVTDLVGMSLTDLMNIRVTSVSRKEQEAGKTAAAVYVITQEDIRRSGAETLPDLLRLVPGLSIAQLNASAWSVASRGFGGIWSNKLLVLIDGRSIYNPSSGGVNWELQFLPFDTIEQIEVVRGPGGSLWGANAINGVINIITKSADQAQGARVSSRVGTYDPGTVSVSYGGRLRGSESQYTMGARYFQRQSPGVARRADAVDTFYTHSRFDWKDTGGNAYSLSAHVQQGNQHQIAPQIAFIPPFSVNIDRNFAFTEGSTNFSWHRVPSSGTETDVQAYYSGWSRQGATYGERWHIGDIEARHRAAIGDRHEVVAGVGYRAMWTEWTNTPYFIVTPRKQWLLMPTAFVQDEVAITRTLSITPGVKVEHNSNTGVELQPSIRALWAATPRQSVWAALSRGVRTPNRMDTALDANPIAVFPSEPLPTVVVLSGDPDFQSETLKAFELGYRVQRGQVSLDLSGFRTHYDGLPAGVEGVPSLGTVFGVPVVRLPVFFDNGNKATTSGIEIVSNWVPTGWNRFVASYAYLDVHLFGNGFGRPTDDAVPAQQFQIRSYTDLPRAISLTTAFSHVSELAATSMAANVAAYHRFDANVGWTYRRQLDLKAGVNNLLHDRAPEYRDPAEGILGASVRPDVYGSIAWRF